MNAPFHLQMKNKLIKLIKRKIIVLYANFGDTPMSLSSAKVTSDGILYNFGFLIRSKLHNDLGCP